MGQQDMGAPTKPKPSRPRRAKTPEALETDPLLIDAVYKKVQAIQASLAAASGIAVTTAIGGVPVRRLARTKDGQPVINKDGDPVWQRISNGRQWEGPSMIARTRWAIAAYDADPLDVAAAVMNGFPPLLKADCPNWTQMDADQVGLAIADLLDENLRSALIAKRGGFGRHERGLRNARGKPRNTGKHRAG